MLFVCWLFQCGSYFVNIIINIVKKTLKLSISRSIYCTIFYTRTWKILFSYKIILSTYLHWLQHHVLIRRPNMYRSISYRTLVRVTICVLVGQCKQFVYIHIRIFFFIFHDILFLIKSVYTWLLVFTLLNIPLWLSKLGSLCAYFHGSFTSSLFHFVLLAGIPRFYFVVGL